MRSRMLLAMAVPSSRRATMAGGVVVKSLRPWQKLQKEEVWKAREAADPRRAERRDSVRRDGEAVVVRYLRKRVGEKDGDSWTGWAAAAAAVAAACSASGLRALRIALRLAGLGAAAAPAPVPGLSASSADGSGAVGAVGCAAPAVASLERLLRRLVQLPLRLLFSDGGARATCCRGVRPPVHAVASVTICAAGGNRAGLSDWAVDAGRAAAAFADTCSAWRRAIPVPRVQVQVRFPFQMGAFCRAAAALRVWHLDEGDRRPVCACACRQRGSSDVFWPAGAGGLARGAMWVRCPLNCARHGLASGFYNRDDARPKVSGNVCLESSVEIAVANTHRLD